MEIGSPQLYAEVNRVARDMDLAYLKELGPFLRALGRVTNAAEYFKPSSEKITNGRSFGGAEFNLAGPFLLWRGAPMKDEWVLPYASQVGEQIRLPHSTSCSLDPFVAVGFAITDEPRKD